MRLQPSPASNQEHGSLEWGGTRIDFNIFRSSRRKTVAVAVEPNGDVTLTVPSAATQARLLRIVRDKAVWIVDKRRRVAQQELPHEREFKSGESVLLLGRQYRLKVVSGPPARATVQQGWLRVAVPDSLPREAAAHYVACAVRDWLCKRADIKLRERVEYWRGKLQLSPTALVLSEQQKRWGSCDKQGTLRFNWRIIQAPLSLVDYVVAHELVHLVHPHHGDRFWAALGQIMPDYEVRRERLRKLGATLQW